MPSWEDGSERYLTEYRGESVYDAPSDLHTFSREGDNMHAETMTEHDIHEKAMRLLVGIASDKFVDPALEASLFIMNPKQYEENR